jgi:hypothetical protein
MGTQFTAAPLALLRLPRGHVPPDLNEQRRAVGYECERGAVSTAEAEVGDHTATVHIPTMTLKKCGFAGSDRDDIDDGSFVVVVRPHLPQCPTGLGSCGDAVPVIHLSVRLLRCAPFVYVFHRQS